MSDIDILRFLDAHNKLYLIAFSELKKGKKESHWMWFIFPQLKVLGKSTYSNYYGINTIEEANNFMSHPVLSRNLIEITELLLYYSTKSIQSIFGEIDADKLLSSMTLFSLTKDAHPIFQEILTVFFFGRPDVKTINLLFPESLQDD